MIETRDLVVCCITGRCTRRHWPLIAGVAAALLTMPCAAQTPGEKLPDAAKVLDRYVEVTGGKAAYAKIKNRVSTGTLEIVGQGLKFSTKTYSARPNKFYSRIESEAMGTIEKGCTGEVAWELNDMVGPQIKSGEEKALIVRSAMFDGAVEWRKLFKKAECVGIEDVGGKPCYKIVLTPVDGETVETRFFEEESNLLVKGALTLKLPAGELPLEMFPGDYKRVDGILLPHTTRQVVAGMQEMRIVVESVKHNVELPKDRFDPPDEVKELIQETKADKPKVEKP